MDAICSRADFRRWLELNHNTAKECWINLKRGRPTDKEGIFWYLDAVEEALCFGWIDSTLRSDGMQRFTPRKPDGHWTELNKARCQRLIGLGLMTEAGMEKYKKAGEFQKDLQMEEELRKAGVLDNFNKFPELYKKIRISNISPYREKDPAAYSKKMERLICETGKGRMYGQWNDWGRLE